MLSDLSFHLFQVLASGARYPAARDSSLFKEVLEYTMFTFALDLVDILLHDAEGEAEVYHLEDPVLAGPEHVGRLQVGVDNALGTALMSQVSQVRTKK